jgi:hypothetical protein
MARHQGWQWNLSFRRWRGNQLPDTLQPEALPTRDRIHAELLPILKQTASMKPNLQ